MLTEVAIALIGILSSVISSFVTFHVTKRKYNAEVDSNLIQNMQDSLQFYDELTKSNTQKLREIEEENRLLRQQVSELQTQVVKLMGNICYDATCRARKLQEEVDKKDKGHEPSVEAQGKKA